MRIVKIVAAALLVSVSAASLALPLKTSDKDSKRSQKTICREFGETGSRLAMKRICLTAEQWRQHTEDQREDLDRAQRIRGGPDQ